MADEADEEQHVEREERDGGQQRDAGVHEPRLHAPQEEPEHAVDAPEPLDAAAALEHAHERRARVEQRAQPERRADLDERDAHVAHALLREQRTPAGHETVGVGADKQHDGRVGAHVREEPARAFKCFSVE